MRACGNVWASSPQSFQPSRQWAAVSTNLGCPSEGEGVWGQAVGGHCSLPTPAGMLLRKGTAKPPPPAPPASSLRPLPPHSCPSMPLVYEGAATESSVAIFGSVDAQARNVGVPPRPGIGAVDDRWLGLGLQAAACAGRRGSPAWACGHAVRGVPAPGHTPGWGRDGRHAIARRARPAGRELTSPCTCVDDHARQAAASRAAPPCIASAVAAARVLAAHAAALHQRELVAVGADGGGLGATALAPAATAAGGRQLQPALVAVWWACHAGVVSSQSVGAAGWAEWEASGSTTPKAGGGRGHRSHRSTSPPRNVPLFPSSHTESPLPPPQSHLEHFMHWRPASLSVGRRHVWQPVGQERHPGPLGSLI